MICAVFCGFDAVRISGHAGFAVHGEDIVCAAVTSAFQFCANGITEILRVDAHVSIGSDTVSIELPDHASLAAKDFLRALKLHLTILCEQYPENIQIMEDSSND